MSSRKKVKVQAQTFFLIKEILRRVYVWIYYRIIHKLHVYFLVLYDRVAFTPGKIIYNWLQRKGIELIDAHTQWIGHAAAHTDYLLKKSIMNKTKSRIILHVYRQAKNNDRWHINRYPNAYLQKLWQRHFGMMIGPFSHHVLHPVMWKNINEPRGKGYKVGNDYPIISRKVGPQLQLPLEDQEKGKRILSKLGVDANAWFFCFYARDDSYKGWGGHDYRNCDVKTLIPSIQHLVVTGGWGIRMGSPRSDKFPIMDHVIDYPHSQYRSDFMDVFLAANCKFFIGSTGGICDLARCVFHATTMYHNFIPLSPRHWKWLTDETTFIPKLIWSNKLGRYMTFKEIYELGAEEFFSNEKYERAGISIHDNTPEDIHMLTEEVFLRKAGLWSQRTDDEFRQTEFRKLIAKYYSHELAGFRISNRFLKKYEFLL